MPELWLDSQPTSPVCLVFKHQLSFCAAFLNNCLGFTINKSQINNIVFNRIYIFLVSVLFNSTWARRGPIIFVIILNYSWLTECQYHYPANCVFSSFSSYFYCYFYYKTLPPPSLLNKKGEQKCGGGIRQQMDKSWGIVGQKWVNRGTKDSEQPKPAYSYRG